jgi:hypothetical protein
LGVWDLILLPNSILTLLISQWQGRWGANYLLLSLTSSILSIITTKPTVLTVSITSISLPEALESFIGVVVLKWGWLGSSRWRRNRANLWLFSPYLLIPKIIS